MSPCQPRRSRPRPTAARRRRGAPTPTTNCRENETGRPTTTTRFLDQLASGHEPPDGLCYVESYRSPEVPRLVVLKPGAGRRLRESLDLMVSELEEHLPAILADPELRRRVERSSGTLRRRERKLVETFEEEARKLGFEVVQIQVGAITQPDLMPVVGDRPVGMEELPSLVEEGALDDLGRGAQGADAGFPSGFRRKVQGGGFRSEAGPVRKRVMARRTHEAESPFVFPS